MHRSCWSQCPRLTVPCPTNPENTYLNMFVVSLGISVFPFVWAEAFIKCLQGNIGKHRSTIKMLCVFLEMSRVSSLITSAVDILWAQNSQNTLFFLSPAQTCRTDTVRTVTWLD